MIAALYVQTGGSYFDLPDVDPYDQDRDARTYAGPWPVVAHPPFLLSRIIMQVIVGRQPEQKGEKSGS